MHLLAVGDSFTRSLWNSKSSRVKLRKIMRRKGDRKRKVSTFRKGNIPPNKGIKCDKLEYKEENDNNLALYIRPTDAEISMAQNNPVVSLQTSPKVSSGVPCKMLRPKPASPLEVEKKNSEGRKGRLVLHAYLWRSYIHDCIQA